MNAGGTLMGHKHIVEKGSRRRVQHISGLFVDKVREIAIGPRRRGFMIVYIIKRRTVNDAPGFDIAKISCESVGHDAVE
jgi:hypothetical protein